MRADWVAGWRGIRNAGDEAIELTVDELNWLLDGIDLWRNRPHQILTPRFVT